MKIDPVEKFVRRHVSHNGAGDTVIACVILGTIVLLIHGALSQFLSTTVVLRSLFISETIVLLFSSLCTYEANKQNTAAALELLQKDFVVETWSRLGATILELKLAVGTVEIMGKPETEYQTFKIDSYEGRKLYKLLKASDNPAYQKAAQRFAERE